MPFLAAAILPITGAVFGGGALTIAGISASTLASLALTGGLTAYQMIAARQAQRKAKRGALRAEDGKLTSKGAVTARRVVGGRALLGGHVIFEEERAGAFYRQLAFCQGPIRSFDEIYINDTAVTIDAAGDVLTDPFFSAGTRFVRLERKLGSVTAATSSALLGSVFSQITASHKGSGVARLAMRVLAPTATQYQNIFKSQVPAVTALVSGSLCYDPRDGVTRWTDNCALVLFNYLTSLQDGRGFPLAAFDLDSVRRTADICDERVPVKAGGTIPRYTYNGVYDLTDEPSAIQQAMLDTMAGDVWINAEGLICMEAGAAPVASLTLTEADLFTVSVTDGGDATTRYNTIKATYTSPDHRYVEVEADIWRNAAAVALEGRERIENKVFTAVNHHNQVRRLSKIVMDEENPRTTVSLTGSIALIECAFESHVRLDLPVDGITPDRIFRVTRFEPSEDMGTVSMELAETDPLAFTFDAASEEGTAPPVPASTVDPALIPPVPPAPIVIMGNTAAGLVARVSWVKTAFDIGGEARFRDPSAVNFGLSPVVINNTYYAVTPPLVPGTLYEFEVRGVRGGVPSPWTATVFLNAAVAAEDLAAPTDTGRTIPAATPEPCAIEQLNTAQGTAPPALFNPAAYLIEHAAAGATVTLATDLESTGPVSAHRRTVSGLNRVSPWITVQLTPRPPTGGGGGAGGGDGGNTGDGGNGGGGGGD